jgi:hypothetical protein
MKFDSRFFIGLTTDAKNVGGWQTHSVGQSIIEFLAAWVALVTLTFTYPLT